MSILSFSEGYRQYFEVIPAVTDALKRQNYRLRHEVYCRDLGFEPLCDNGLETDAYDRHSLHCLIRALVSGAFVGCARLVLADPLNPQDPLPFESACAATLNRQIIDTGKLDRSKIAEISRLAILGRYRQRQGEACQPFALETHLGEGYQLRLPYLPVAMYLALLAVARRQGIETLFVLTEPTLARNINCLGGELTPIGGAIEHRGTRVPAMVAVAATIDGMNSYVRPFFELIANEVDVGMAPTSDEVTTNEHSIGSLLRA